MLKPKYTIYIAIAVILFLVITDCGGSNAFETASRAVQIGEKAPDFELTKTDGAKATLEILNGKPAVLVFWSLYCSKCKKETPQINQLAKEFSPKGVEIIGINTGESNEEIRKGVESFGIEYAVAPDEGKQVMQTFGAVGTPTIIFLDKQGKVQFYGNKLPENYAERLKALS